MFTTRRLIIVATAVAVLSGCASPNPYGGQGQAQGQADSGSEGMSKTRSMVVSALWPVRWRVLRSTTITVARAR